MTPDQFIDLVKKMRSAQKGFFSSDPNSSARRVFLNESRVLEKQVDEAIKAFESNQIKLF